MSVTDLLFKSGAENIAGLVHRMYIADKQDVFSWPSKKTTNGEGDKITLDGNILLKPGKLWKTVDIICDTGKIRHSAVGSKAGRCWDNRLDFKMQKDIGADEWFNFHVNFCGIILIKEKNGRYRVFGNDDEGARFDTIEGSTGANIFDEKSWVASIIDKTGSICPYYDGVIAQSQTRSFSASFSASFG